MPLFLFPLTDSETLDYDDLNFQRDSDETEPSGGIEAAVEGEEDWGHSTGENDDEESETERICACFAYVSLSPSLTHTVTTTIRKHLLTLVPPAEPALMIT